MSEPCSAILPTHSSGYWYDIDGNQYTCADIKALSNPAGTYYATLDLVEYELNEKKYVSLNSIRLYHDLLNAEIDIKLDGLKEEFSVSDITSEEIQDLFV